MSEKPENEKITTTPTPPPKEHTHTHKKEKSKYKYRWYVPLTYILGPVDNVTDVNATTESPSSEDSTISTTTQSIKNGGSGKKSDLKNIKQSPISQNSTQKPAELQKGGKNKNGTGGNSLYGNGTHLIWMNMTEGLYFQ